MWSPRQLVGMTEEGDGQGILDEVVIPKSKGVTQGFRNGDRPLKGESYRANINPHHLLIMVSRFLWGITICLAPSLGGWVRTGSVSPRNETRSRQV